MVVDGSGRDAAFVLCRLQFFSGELFWCHEGCAIPLVKMSIIGVELWK